MATTARERLAGLLGGSEPTGTFSAELLAPAHLLQLEVAGVGPVNLPIRTPAAKKLIAAARPAMFGRGERTLTDPSVRDTWELTPGQVTLGGPGWASLLDTALTHFRDKLGLPRTARLRVEPHSMLIYGKGQFFLPHQDSQKHDAMVGTLVVSLPSAHTGGELVIDHAGETRTYRASREQLTLIAFYADCRHQVTPVRSGHRVTLTFNLLADTEPAAQETGPAAELALCLTEHFATQVTTRYGGDLGPPNRLVFLLDHEYAQRGLDWRRLKGADAQRAAQLQAAAEQAGCEAVLALAEIKETWDAEPSDDDPWGHGYDDEEDSYEEYEEQDSGEHRLNSLIDDEITLGWWTSPDGSDGEPISLHLSDHEVCASTPNTDLLPYQSEFEGYMGNYGNTLDRWYRRAAVVLWPRDRAFAARAEAGSQWALRELGNLIAAGELESARRAAESLTPFWKRTATQPGLLAATLDAAAGLDAAGTATMLLEPFRVETLGPEHAGGLAAAAGRYGEPWLAEVIDGWFGPAHRYGTGREQWVARLPELCGALRTAGAAQPARLLTTMTWHWLAGQLRSGTATARTEFRRPQLEMLGTPLVRLLDAAEDTLHEEITAALREYGDTLLECLMPALRSAHPRRPAALEAVVRDCVQRLETILARPQRDRDDWSVEWTGCRCDLCATLAEFLRSRSRQVLEWPLVKAERGHVHTQIDSAGLPVRHETRRQGRPYTLVLTKTDALFTRAEDARQQAMADLAWLTSTWVDAPATART